MVRRYGRAALSVAAVAAVVVLLSMCGNPPVEGSACGEGELWHRVTLDSGDVLECRPVSAEDQAWTLAGHNAEAGSLVWVGWLLAVVGVSVLVAGLVGIVAARYGRRRAVRRSE